MPLGGVVQIHPVIQEPHTAGKGVRLLDKTLGLALYRCIIDGKDPRDGQERKNVVSIAWVDAQSITTALGSESGQDAWDRLIAKAYPESSDALEGLENRIGDVEDLREESSAVSVSGCAEELPVAKPVSKNINVYSITWSLPATTRCRAGQFRRQVGHRRDPHGVSNLRPNVREICQSRRERLRLGVFEVVCNYPSCCYTPAVAVDDNRVRIITCVGTSEFSQCFDLLVFGTDRVVHETSPEGTLFECLEVEPSDNPEVVGTTFEGKEEVGIALSIGVDNLAMSEYNLGSSAIGSVSKLRCKPHN